MSNLINFQFNNNQVRTVVKDDQIWFVATDVCKALDYANPSDAVATHLDDDEKMTIANSDSHSGKRGGSRFMVIINESGLYALVLRSRKPEARKFAKWVTSEVLPSIRKTGAYHASAVSLEPQAIINARKQLTEAVWNKGGVKVDWSQIMPDGEAALGLIGSVLMSSQWLARFDCATMVPQLYPISDKALMLTPDELIERFTELNFTDEQTRALLNKCADYLLRYKELLDEAKKGIECMARKNAALAR